jgi:ABC-type transport system involved in Fe-S cluster assembly fused permease/ATPase subunit
VAYHTFQHVLDLDTNFHLERRTGALSRILERGALACGRTDQHEQWRMATSIPHFL